MLGYKQGIRVINNSNMEMDNKGNKVAWVDQIGRYWVDQVDRYWETNG